MKSKLIPLVMCCLLYAIGVGQWSIPEPLLSGSTDIGGQALAAGSGDTAWATVVSTAVHQCVVACWTTGGPWSHPVLIARPDSIPVFHDPGMGRDASGRMWAAWYKDGDSSGVWAAFRDSAGWHASRVYSGGPAAGPMSFASDAAGNWYLGYATLMPYSSAVCSRWTGDSWESPCYIARGASDPLETNFYAPKLVTRPDSGLWAVYEMSIGGSSRISMMKIVQRDTVRGRWIANGTDPAVTADSAGRLWILYSELARHWVTSQMIVDSSPVDTQLITDVAEGPACVTCAGGHVDGLVWMAWPHYTSHRVMANFAFETEWSPPGQVSDSEGVPKGIAAANERVCVVFQTPNGRLYSVYGKSTPGIQQRLEPIVATSRHLSVVRGVLFLSDASNDKPQAASLLDISGRHVLGLRPGANDVRALAPGVYFIRTAQAQAQAQAIRKVVVAE